MASAIICFAGFELPIHGHGVPVPLCPSFYLFKRETISSPTWAA